MSKEIPLVEGGFATVDDEMYDLLRHFTWHKCGFCSHVYRTVPRYKDGDYTIYMAAEVLGNETLKVNDACNPQSGIKVECPDDALRRDR